MLEYRFSMEDDDDDFEQESNINMDDDIGDYDEDDDEETIVVTETVVSSVFPPSAPVIDKESRCQKGCSEKGRQESGSEKSRQESRAQESRQEGCQESQEGRQEKEVGQPLYLPRLSSQISPVSLPREYKSCFPSREI